MDRVKWVGLDVHQATISAAVMDSEGRVVMECVLATRAGAILDFLPGVAGNGASHLGRRNSLGVALQSVD
jgi:TctA family transporter